MSASLLVKSHKKRIIAIAVVSALFVLVAIFMVANKIAPISWGWWGNINSADGVAIGGYDVVAYHTEGNAKKGDAEKSYFWKDTNWYFVSEKNKALFKANPDSFIPQYGGYCAYAISKGVTANSSPDSWVLEEGKLYFLADDQVKASWVNGTEGGIVNKADENWLKR